MIDNYAYMTKRIQNSMQVNHQKAQVNMERLASGLRINRARDDAAGLQINATFHTQIRAHHQVARGINDGVSLVQTADGALNQVQSLLQKARELSVQAANAILTPADRLALDQEYKATKAEIDRIAYDTEIFGRYPLRERPPIPVEEEVIPTQVPAPPPVQRGNIANLADQLGNGVQKMIIRMNSIEPIGFIAAGATNLKILFDSYAADDDLQIFTTDGKHLVGTPLTDATWSGVSAASILTIANGFNPGASYDTSELIDNSANFFYHPDLNSYVGLANTHTLSNGSKITYSGDGYMANYQEFLHIDHAKEDLLLIVSGSGGFDITASWDFMPTASQPAPVEPEPEQDAILLTLPKPLPEGIDILTSANMHQGTEYVRVEYTPSDTKTLGLQEENLRTQQAASSAIEALDNALELTSAYRVQYGAIHNRFEKALSQYDVSLNHLYASNSRIVDADYAQETAALIKHQVLTESGMQAHKTYLQQNQEMLTLFQDLAK